jgi:hypothetical protein
MSVGFCAPLAREPPGSWEVIPGADMRKGLIFDTLCKWFLQHYTNVSDCPVRWLKGCTGWPITALGGHPQRAALPAAG